MALVGDRWFERFDIERAVRLEVATAHLIKVLEPLLVNY
jgi:hypothetical protein